MIHNVNDLSDIASRVQKLHDENERLIKENKRLSIKVNKLLKKLKTLRLKKNSAPASKVKETNWSIVSREVQ